MITLTVLKRHFVTYYFGCITNLRKRHARKLDFVGPRAALQLFSLSPSEELCGAKSISLVCDLRVMSKHSEAGIFINTFEINANLKIISPT